MRYILIIIFLAPFFIHAQDLNYYNKGLAYSYLQGSVNKVSEIATLNTTRNSASKNFDMTVADSTFNFAIIWKGFINLTVEGKYTFYTSSDDGSQLFIDSMLIVDNDGLHLMRERSAARVFTAGLHLIELKYFNKLGGKGLSVSYAGPNFLKQQIPDSVLFVKDTALVYSITSFLVTDTAKNEFGVLTGSKYSFSIDGYEVWKLSENKTYMEVIDKLDLQKNKLPKNYRVWIGK